MTTVDQQPSRDRGACPHCGSVAADGPALPAVLEYADPTMRHRYRWVWCHFFRNGFVVVGSASVIGCVADFPHQASWIVGAVACFATAMGFHFWHDTVCAADGQT